MAETAKKAEVAVPKIETNLWNLTVICVLAWIIPGTGHFLLKRTKVGLVFLLSIILLFFWGLSLGAKIYHYEAQQPLTFFAMIAQLGMGLPYFIIRYLISYYGNMQAGEIPAESSVYHFLENFRFGNGNTESLTFEYGNTFVIVAGLLNFLVILDAYDAAVGRKKK